MEQHTETIVEKLLTGGAEGAAVALRGCSEEVAHAVADRFGDAFVRVRLWEPCRVEHPHSAFLRKTVDSHGRAVQQTTLYAPGGRLTEERAQDGAVLERFVKKPADFELLRGHLRDVELHPARALPPAEGCATIACVGLTPLREMETRWAGIDLMATALMTQDESAASCLRKLERQLHRRCEEACTAGCRLAVLRDMATEPLPDTYLMTVGRHLEWMRHNGLAPFVEVSQPNEPLLAALNAAHAGARMDLADAVRYGESSALPEGLKLLFDVSGETGLGSLPPERVKALLGKCGSAVLLLDCFEAELEPLFRTIDGLLSTIARRP